MPLKRIEIKLNSVLLEDGSMNQNLYQSELEELVSELMESVKQDGDEFLFAVTENRNQVAMVLIESSGKVYINEEARSHLRQLWPTSYETNLQQLIPLFARQLEAGEIPINGVKNVSPH